VISVESVDNSKKRVTLILGIYESRWQVQKRNPYDDVDGSQIMLLFANKKVWCTEPEFAVYLMNCIGTIDCISLVGNSSGTVGKSLS